MWLARGVVTNYLTVSSFKGKVMATKSTIYWASTKQLDIVSFIKSMDRNDVPN